MVPITITLGILNFNALIDTFFAQYVSDSAAAYIRYSFRLYQLPQGIFAVTIGTVLFPTLSRYAAQHDMEQFRETLSAGIRQMIYVSLPFLAWFTILAAPVVRLIYQRGHSRPATRSRWRRPWRPSPLGLTFANVNIMLNRGFQSLQRPWLPLYVGLVNLGLNALLDWVLLKPFGVAGITLSTSLVSIFNLVVLVLLLRRRWAHRRAPHRALASAAPPPALWPWRWCRAACGSPCTGSRGSASCRCCFPCSSRWAPAASPTCACPRCWVWRSWPPVRKLWRRRRARRVAPAK